MKEGVVCAKCFTALSTHIESCIHDILEDLPSLSKKMLWIIFKTQELSLSVKFLFPKWLQNALQALET